MFTTAKMEKDDLNQFQAMEVIKEGSIREKMAAPGFWLMLWSLDRRTGPYNLATQYMYKPCRKLK